MTLKVGNNQYKVGVKEYYKPTPRILRYIGDGLLTISSLLTITFAKTNPTVAIIAAVAGTIGKFLTNFTSVTKTN
jgi:hypothetical protein